MATRIEVDRAVLDGAGQGWQQAADDLAGAALRLGQVTGAGLAPRPAAEVDRFVTTWGSALRRLAQDAQDDAGATTVVWSDFSGTDVEQARRLWGLLP